MKILDVLNILLPINATFTHLAWEKFNPRNAMYISRNDGMFNVDACVQRDTLINANTMLRMSRGRYTEEEIAHIRKVVEIRDEILRREEQ